MPDTLPAAILVSELFPPAVGGSAVLFDHVYSRVRVPLTVITDDRFEESAQDVAVIRRRLRTDSWGISNPSGLQHHLSVAATIRRVSRHAGPGALVHCGRILPEGVAARLARMAGGRRFVCWAHGEDLATASSSRELTWMTKWVLRGASAVFANSYNTKSVLTGFGVDADMVYVVYPGVDCERFRPDVDGTDVRARHGLTNDLVVLSVGRLQARKGHDVAIRALARLSREIPTLKYLIVGAGEERPALDALVRELELDDRVIFAGEIGDDELPRYYAASDIFLLANRIEQGDFEGFGIVFLEAAASGKVVIGGTTGGVAEAVADGETGLLVDAADVGAVQAALQALARSPERRQAMGAAGRTRAQIHFTWEAAASRVEDAHIALA
jgi:phosphatidylinositol alpha-1,6-mannosyltransferase